MIEYRTWARHSHHTSGDHVDPVKPRPTRVLPDEPANERSDHWAGIRSRRKDRNGESPLLWTPDIGNCATREGERRRTEEPAQKARDEQAADIRS